VKRFCWLSKVTVLLLLNILCWTKVAHSQLSVNSASLNFGSVQTGSSTSQALILSNSGKSSLTVSQAIVAGQGFSLLRSPSLPFTLTSGQSVTVNLAFAPVSGSGASGSFSLVSSAISTHDRSGKHNSVSTATTTVVLNGSGSVPSPVVTPGLLVAYPSSLGFSALQAGSSQTLSATVTNSGGTAVTISAGGTHQKVIVLGGLAEMSESGLTVLADVATSLEDLDRAQFADSIAEMEAKLAEKEGSELDSAIERLDHFKSIQQELTSTAMH